MRRIDFAVVLLVVGSVLAGCICVDGPYNQPTEVKLRLVGETARQYTVEVLDKGEVQVDSDGSVALDIPRIQRSHSTYLFGVIRVRTSKAENMPIIILKKGRHAFCRLSLKDLERLPTDVDGYKLLKVE